MRRTAAICIFFTVFLARFPSSGVTQPLWVDLDGTGGPGASGTGRRGSGPETVLSSAKELTLGIEIPGFYRGEERLADGKTYATVAAAGAGQGGIQMPISPSSGRLS